MTLNIKYLINQQEVSQAEFKRRLPDRLALASLDNALSLTQKTLGTARCPVHNEAARVTISFTSTGRLQVVTASCCDMFARATTAPLNRALKQTAYFSPGNQLYVFLDGHSEPWTFDTATIIHIVIGRTSPASGEPVAIDLQKFKGQDKGVSRRHATISWHRGALHVTDEDSANGTYLNGERLNPRQPYKLHDGDALRVGEMMLHVLLVEAPV